MTGRLETSLEYIQTLIRAQYSAVIENRAYILNTPAGFYTIHSYKMPSVGIVYAGGTPDNSKPDPQYWKRNVDIYVYQSIWKPETAVIGTDTTKGVVQMVDDLKVILNNAKDPTVGIVRIWVTGDIEPGQIPNFNSEGFSAFAGLKLSLTEE
jgi:hypothetical protein